MPELPELEAMRDALMARIIDRRIAAARAIHPGILKTVDPPLSALVGESASDVARRGKHLILRFREDLCLVIHLMLAGRLVFSRSGAKPTKATGFILSFGDGEDLRVVENSTVRRAGVFVVRSPLDIERIASCGVEPLSGEFTVERLAAAAAGVRRQLKRFITDQRTVAGIGSAYADEIAFDARLSPLRYVSTLSADEIARLHASTQRVLRDATDHIRGKSRGAIVGEQDRSSAKVYKRTGEPCPVCQTPIAEIRYAERRTYYCPRCQAGGKTLRDRRSWLTR